MLLKKIIQSIAGAASTRGTRPTLECVCITKDTVVATDSYKLLEYKLGDTSSEDFPRAGRIPVDLKDGEQLLINAKELRKFKFKTSKNLPILSNALLHNKTDTHVSLLSTDLNTENVATFRLNNGEYPNYQRVIPTSAPSAIVSVDAQYLIEVLSAFVNSGAINNNVTLSIHPDGAPLMVTNDKKDITGLVMPLRNH